MKFGVGVIGATGFIGTTYRKEIREAVGDADIIALCARRRGPLEEAAREDGASLVTDDWREVVEHPDVDLVLVVTPDALHHEVVMACAKLGKHMICDKPIGANAREAYEMWSAYKSSSSRMKSFPTPNSRQPVTAQFIMARRAGTGLRFSIAKMYSRCRRMFGSADFRARNTLARASSVPTLQG